MTKKIPIKGDIVDNNTAMFYQFFGMDAVSPQVVSDILNNGDDDDVELSIASNGGDVFAASEIYTMLRNYKGNVSVNIEGLAASAASVIAMAGDTVKISPTAQIMIHKAWSGVQGNSDDMEHESQVLGSIDDSIVNAYAAKTGLDEGKLLNLMANETWLGAEDAVNQGFADEIMFVNEDEPVTMNSISNIPNKKAINKFMNLVMKANLNKKEESRPKVANQSLRDKKLVILIPKNKKEAK
ncbi:head maturation protease, ClpP-related [Pediococcus claussenii]|uniref:head maturation protease, ClpP-related n=1 Tax=Pediococcus claussenii TaxID=187452 RepID=UPI00081AA02C|nr:head maturation protease, ClpP-related [Pediococcus claussenii]ANZ70368.1 peptidase [Pediococcus claussenii]ANZ72184.1 peptidase [Pediococcus claussenii]